MKLYMNQGQRIIGIINFKIMYKIKVNCTKEHLEKAKYCTTKMNVSQNCWIAVALHDIFPECNVRSSYIDNMSSLLEGKTNKLHWKIKLPKIAQYNIILFDMCKTIEEREKLEPFSFEIEFDQNTFETILKCNGFSHQQFKDKVSSTKHLQLTEV